MVTAPAPPATSAMRSLEADHLTVEELFTQFEQRGRRAKKGRVAVVAKIEALSTRAAIEETVFYAATLSVSPATTVSS